MHKKRAIHPPPPVLTALLTPHKIKIILFILFHRITEGYSGSDLAALAREAALMPIRGCDFIVVVMSILLLFFHLIMFHLVIFLKTFSQIIHRSN